MSYQGPKWTPKPGVTYLMPGVYYSPGGGGASNASRLESLRTREKELLQEGALGSERHPRHLDAVYEYRALQKQILAIDTPASGPEVKSSPNEYDPELLRELEAQSPAVKVEWAKQIWAEIRGKPKDGYWNASDPTHEGQKRLVNRALEIIGEQEK